MRSRKAAEVRLARRLRFARSVAMESPAEARRPTLSALTVIASPLRERADASGRFLAQRVGVDDGIMAETRRIGGFSVDFQPMSPEDMQRAMQFLLSQQAQFAANIAKNEARWTEQFDQLSSQKNGSDRRRTNRIDRHRRPARRVAPAHGRTAPGVRSAVERG